MAFLDGAGAPFAGELKACTPEPSVALFFLVVVRLLSPAASSDERFAFLVLPEAALAWSTEACISAGGMATHFFFSARGDVARERNMGQLSWADVGRDEGTYGSSTWALPHW